MAQPPRYERKKNFTVNLGWETDHVALNAELDGAAKSINAIRSNLALIQRDDGKLVQGIVTADSVEAGFADELSGKVSSGVQGALNEAHASVVSATLAANAAENSRNSAAGSATSAATSASAAASSASSAALSSGNSTTKAGEAAASAASAAASKDAAAASATTAAVAATNADLAKNNAATSASNAATSASNAGNSALAAAASAQAAATTYDTFDDRFLGAKAADPALDNDGQSLQTGAMYWRTTSNEMRIWTGTAWQTPTPGIPVDGSVTTAKLANGVLTADAAGRAKMADLFVTQAKLADSILTPDAAGRNKMAAGYVSQDKMATNVAGTGPAFSAFLSGIQNISTAMWTRVNLVNKSFDTNSNLSSARFTATIPGYYAFSFLANMNAPSMTHAILALYRNGVENIRGAEFSSPSAFNAFCATGTSTVVLGVGDYVEVYVYIAGTTPSLSSANFSGCLVRAI